MSIRVFTDRRCFEHRVPRGYPELPERLESILVALESAGFPVEEKGEHPETPSAITAVHDSRYDQRFRGAVESGEPFIDTGDNPLSPGTWNAACAAVDATLHAMDWVLEEPDRRAVAAVRPPGHHAEHAMAMGFCYFNNVAVAAEYAFRVADLSRAARAP